jgi:hypothetical protein
VLDDAVRGGIGVGTGKQVDIAGISFSEKE